jgi:transcription antitermination factor NusG
MGWSCVHTYVGQEERVVDSLGMRWPRMNGVEKFEAFCPTYRAPLPGRPPPEFREIPLFPGYVFVNLGEGQPWDSINSTPGVIRLLTDRNQLSPKPLPVSEATMLDLRQRLVDTPVLRPGARVRITNARNCFVEFEGIVDSLTKDQRVMVRLSFLNRDQVVRFDYGDLTEV